MANESNEWAKNEFGDAVLGDKRLTDRLLNHYRLRAERLDIALEAR
nr:transposase [Wolbachia endosymbiont (group A) of Epagoge grotiana]